ncbi:32708_t:CDS:2 [Gigaspora margarita]|uniref:32708_t:CDS:1 n=1 Tax=Gigaspora margarita TaxID=4874 RepID=A0ABN7W7D9_GIGMA|nr:32708_t:CDS:2 [Gigaspora margarita]
MSDNGKYQIKKQERKFELIKLQKVLNEWKNLRTSCLKCSIIYILFGVFSLVIGILLLTLDRNEMLTILRTISTSIISVGSIGAFVESLKVLKDIYTEKDSNSKKEGSDEKFDDIMIEMSMTANSYNLEKEVNFMKSIINNLRYTIFCRTMLIILMTIRSLNVLY